jgi:hypothetical protein
MQAIAKAAAAHDQGLHDTVKTGINPCTAVPERLRVLAEDRDRVRPSAVSSSASSPPVPPTAATAASVGDWDVRLRPQGHELLAASITR